MKKIALFLSIILTSVTVFAQQSYDLSQLDIPGRETELLRIDSDGKQRVALMVLPKVKSEEKSPLVFVFHGRGGQIKGISRRMAIHNFWPEAVVVYPQGEWGQGRLIKEGFGWVMPSVEDEGMDIRFFDKLYEKICSDYNIDTNRVYSMGHSNGGGMTLALWATRADRFAAFAPSATAHSIFFRTFYMIPKPLFYMARQEDELVKFTGIQICLRKILRINNCQSPVNEENYIVKYSSAEGNDVWTSFPHGGHTMQPNVYSKVVEFFKAHPRKKSGISTSEL
ncbi:MAG: prolyl oligopeptidase family serine peptidase [Alistipes sp.]|nr:prolyl oligopeptidase family serine peptidase [Candidatus Alistipes equi]